MNKLFIIPLLFSMNVSFAQSPEINTISIRTHDRCLQGVVYENLEIDIHHLGGVRESVELDLRCDFDNKLDFRTSTGYQCTAESGACSGFYPEEQVIIECRRDGHAKMAQQRIACK